MKSVSFHCISFFFLQYLLCLFLYLLCVFVHVLCLFICISCGWLGLPATVWQLAVLQVPVKPTASVGGLVVSDVTGHASEEKL